MIFKPDSVSGIALVDNPLDRAAHLCADEAARAALLARPAARALPIWRGKPLIHLEDSINSDAAPRRLARLPWTAGLAARGAEPPVFLGLENGAGLFAIDVSKVEDPEADAVLTAAGGFIDFHAIMGALAPGEGGIGAQARAMLEWHRAHRFCACCGALSVPTKGGWRRDCAACGGRHFPRTDPVVIMLVMRGDRCVLGRQPGWPEGLHSALAGFVEPGETLEAAVRREVAEEVGLPVGRVRYVASQPWPFPMSLMFGCAAEALADDLTVDGDELEAALWVDRADMRRALAGEHRGILGPRSGPIARSLVEAWVDGRIADFD